jgi:hypothetical protein
MEIEMQTIAGRILFLGIALAWAGCSAPSAADRTDPTQLGKADRCAEATPFVSTSAPVGWNHLGNIIVANQGAPNHRGQDVIVGEGEPQVLIAKFAYGLIDKDLKGEDVEVFIQEDPPCGAWVSLGTALTSREGEYGSRYGIDDDGGRVFFEIPAKHARPVGRYPIRMLVKGDHSVAAFSLVVLPPGTSTVVFDIDGTLTTDDYQLVAQLFAELFHGSYTPAIYPDVAQVAQAWWKKGYFIAYLTGRPDYLRTISLEWLKERGLPPGALHLTDTNSQAVPIESGVGRYKSQELSRMVSEAQVDLFAAYGNATTDISAYQAAGIPKDHTFIIGKNAGQDETIPLSSYTDQLGSMDSIPEALVPAPPATLGW